MEYIIKKFREIQSKDFHWYKADGLRMPAGNNKFAARLADGIIIISGVTIS